MEISNLTSAEASARCLALLEYALKNGSDVDIDSEVPVELQAPWGFPLSNY